MLYKSELQNIPFLPFPKITRGKTCRQSHQYAIAASMFNLPRSGEVLVVDVFAWEDKQFRLRFAADQENYLVAEYALNEWSKKNPSNQIDIYSSSERDEDVKMVREFLMPEYSYCCSSVLPLVSEFIQEKNRERRWKAADSKELLMRKHFTMYPDYPENLTDYCDANVFDTYYLFISKIQPHGKRDARCSHCGKKFRVAKELKHNTETVCPKCGKPVTCKGSWVNGAITEKARICIAANVDQQLLLRWVNVERKYSFPKYERSYSLDTYAYNLYLKSGKVYFYKLVSKPYMVGLDWYRGRLGDQCFDEAYIYADNLSEVFGDRYYNVDLQAGLSGKHPPFNFNALLNNLKSEPAAEYLFKMGLTRLTSELHLFRYIPDDISFKDLFGVGKEYVPMFREMNVNLSEVKVVRMAKCWVTSEMLAQWRELDLDQWRSDDVQKLLKRISFARFLNYMTKQKALIKKTGNHCLQLWMDYIRMSENLNIDLSSKSVLLPRNIKDAHDRLLDQHTKALALLQVPEEDLEEFVEVNDIENMSTRELQQAIKERNEAVDAKNAAIQARDESLQEITNLTEQVEQKNADIDRMIKETAKVGDKLTAKDREIEKLKADVAAANKKAADAKADLKKAKENPDIPAAMMEQLRADAEKTAAEKAAADVQKKLDAANRERDAIREELNCTQQKLDAAQKAAQLQNPAAAVFKELFTMVQEDFQKLHKSLLDVQQADPALGAKLKTAVERLLSKLIDDLEV